MSGIWTPNRRSVLRTLTGTAAAAAFSGSLFRQEAFAEELLKTPAMAEGPFYPDKLPLDTDNDLLIINDSITRAIGEITHLTGRVLTATGSPIRNAFVEIWQVDNNGVYLHSGSSDKGKEDANFQGYGRFLTDHKGQYYFRTVKPVTYPGRTPHIHVGVSRGGKRIFTTQLLINGHPGNEKDGLYKSITDPLLRETLLVDFKPLPDSKIGELTANFDMVLGVTAEELEDGNTMGVPQPDRVTRRRR